VILSGVTQTSPNVYGDGWITFAGEVVPFVGGTNLGNVTVNQTVSSKTFRDSNTQQVIYSRSAGFTSGAGVPFTSFTAITLQSLNSSVQAEIAAVLAIANAANATANNALTVANSAASSGSSFSSQINTLNSQVSTLTTNLSTLQTAFNNQKNSTKIFSVGNTTFGRGSNAPGNLFPGNTDINPQTYFGYGGSNITIGPFPVNVNVFVTFNMIVRTNDSGGQEYIYMRLTNNGTVFSEGYFRALVQNTNNGNSPDPDIAVLNGNLVLSAGNTITIRAIVNNYANQVNTPAYHGSQMTAVVVPV
jgi:hypothetical protein